MSTNTQKTKKQTTGWLGLAGALILSAIAPQNAQLIAVQLSDGTTVFDSPPRLVEFTSLRRDANDRRAIYYVTVDLPPDSGESLKTLQVIQTQGRFFPRLQYRLDEIEVFRGDRQNRGETLPVESAEYDEDTETLTLHLAEAAEPGQIITFALKPVRNPSDGGVYLFEVIALPEGDRPVAQRVGTGRLNIFRSDGNDPFEP